MRSTNADAWHRRWRLPRALSASAAAVAIAEDKELTIFDWSGYEAPDFHPEYIEKNGDSPTFTFFGDEDEAFEKLRAGFKADLAPSLLAERGEMARGRPAAAARHLEDRRLERPHARHHGDEGPGHHRRTARPGSCRGTGATRCSPTIPRRSSESDIQSLKAFADPKFKDRVSIGDNVDDAYALASLAIGLKDWTQMTDEQFKQASDFLRQVHKNVRLYWTDTTEIVQALSGGEVDLAWAWNDAGVQSAAAGAPIKAKRDTDEGLSTWVCGYVRLKDAPGSADKAYDFLNAVNDPEVAKLLVKDWGYGHGNAKGMAAIDPAVLAGKGLCRRREIRRQDAVPVAGADRAEAEDDRRVREDQGRVLSVLPAVQTSSSSAPASPACRRRIELRGAGIDVLLLEARDRVGGRVEARAQRLGERVDTGGQFLCEDMPELMALARGARQDAGRDPCRRATSSSSRPLSAAEAEQALCRRRWRSASA